MQDRFSISDTIDGSATSYTIKNHAINGEFQCGPDISINTSEASNSCTGDNSYYCVYSTEVCSSTESYVTAFATNVLGHGRNFTTTIGELSNHRASLVGY